jgi:hydrogenase maturation protease
MTATTERVVVIGVGNPWRRDDGAGPAVATAFRARLDDSVAVLELDGEAARLVDAWDGADLAVVVDAVRTGAVPGTVHLLEADADAGGEAGPAGRTTSSHGLGVEQAIELARVFGRLPRRLVLVGIEGADFGPGSDVTPGVAAAVGPAVRVIADVVQGRA